MTARANPCQECGSAIPPEHRRGPRRKLCTACATRSTYQRRWLARRPDYGPAHNAARRVAYAPVACTGCGLTFTPHRRDSRYCCGLCSQHGRVYGPFRTPESRAAHIARHPDSSEVARPPDRPLVTRMPSQQMKSAASQPPPQ